MQLKLLLSDEERRDSHHLSKADSTAIEVCVCNATCCLNYNEDFRIFLHSWRGGNCIAISKSQGFLQMSAFPRVENPHFSPAECHVLHLVVALESLRLYYLQNPPERGKDFPKRSLRLYYLQNPPERGKDLPKSVNVFIWEVTPSSKLLQRCKCKLDMGFAISSRGPQQEGATRGCKRKLGTH